MGSQGKLQNLQKHKSAHLMHIFGNYSKFYPLL